MRNHFYLRLAFRNIGKNGRFYFPFLLTSAISAAIFFILCNLSLSEDLPGGGYMTLLMGMGTWVVAIFCGIFLFYTNSFLIRRRKKELGLYDVLGMEKRHIGRVLFWETAVSFLISIAGGLLCGVVLNKLSCLLLLNIIHFDVDLALPVLPKAVILTVLLFLAVFLLLFLFNLRQVRKSNPIELLHGENIGEKEPKVKKLLVIVGVLALGAGYALSLMMTELQTVVSFFFVPVILVVIGTYCLFTAGSIAVLKAMKRKKSYYYQPQHFISVSGMLYRMKQNAAGLASICVLSTMVLVILSTTVSLYAGMKDVMDYRYPTNTHIASADISEPGKNAVYYDVEQTKAETGLSVKPAESYVSLASTMYRDGNTFQTESGSLVYTVFLNEKDYTELTGKTLGLSEGETVLYASDAYEADDAVILGRDYRIRDRLAENPVGKLSYIMSTTFVFVLPDDGFREQLGEELTKAHGMTIVPLFHYYFDVAGSDEDVLAFYHRLVEISPADTDIECRQDNVDDFYVLYGGFLFIGIFLGTVFLMATVLIIYYKQLIEGYEDRNRFDIMRRVGMEKSLIRTSVKSQVLTMFALPLLAAAVHLIFAFPMLSRMLHALNLTNVPLFIGCTVVTFAVFAVFYVVTYLLTARAYYTVISSDR